MMQRTWLGVSPTYYLMAVLLLGGGTYLTYGPQPTVVAQEDDLGVGGDKAAGKPAAKTDELEQKKQSFLSWLYESLGLSYTVAFLGMSFSFVALFVMCLLQLRRESFCPPALVEAFEAQLNEKKYQEAYEIAKNDESLLGQLLSAGLAKLSAGYAQAMEAMQEVGEEESMKLEHRLSYIALIGTLAPMVGLLGTVDGMIRSFSIIANSPTQPKPSQLASGISTALVTTIVGLLIAIPAIGAFNIMKNRMARMMLEVGILSEGLMSRFENPSGGVKQG